MPRAWKLDRSRGSGLLAAAALLAAPGVASAADRAPDPVWGEVLAGLGACARCHTAAGGAPYAGGYAIVTKFGTFYGPNITPDPNAGIGAWSYADFTRALRDGRSPEGHAYWPAFPYSSYTRLTDGDLADLWAYLQTIPPSAEPSLRHDLDFPYGRWSIGFWRGPGFDPGEYEPDPTRSEAWNRGRYLAVGPGHCGDCHSPRSAIGVPSERRYLGGNDDPPDPSPNITPSDSGIGDWSAYDLETLLESGMTAEGDFVGGQMRPVVRDGTAKLSPEDRAALAEYLSSVPPVDSRTEKDEE